MKTDKVLVQVVIRLEEWALWYSRDQGGARGYPSVSVAYGLWRGNPKQKGWQPPAEHAAAEEIERWVVEMAQQNPLMAKALRAHYFDHKPLRQQALCLGVSHTGLKAMLDMAHQWLAGRLSLMRD